MDVCIDTRKIKKGQTFIPVKGPNFDGRDYIEDAIKKGATVLDVDLTDYAKKYRKKLNCMVLGITGSAGKTTAKDMLASVLSKAYKVVKTAENENNEVGVPLSILKADATTEILIVEMGMRHKGDMKHLAQIVRPTHMLITNIGLTHIAQFKQKKDIAKAKAECFLPPLKWETQPRKAFLKHNDDYYKYLSQTASKKGYTILPFQGQNKVDSNIDMCYTIGRHFKLTDEQIANGIKDFQPSAHRLEENHINGISIIDDTYNANPDGVAYALEYFKGITGRRKILVLGDMLELGHFSKEAHQAVVDDALNANVDCIVTFGKESQHIQSDTLCIDHYLSKTDLHNHLKNEIKAGDCILLKGSRAMKLEETVAFLKEEARNI